MSTKQTEPLLDQVDQVVAGIRRGVERLVQFLGDEDMAVIERAALALAEIGPSIVDPLATALPKASAPRHRLAIVGALITFGPHAKAQVTRALTQAIQDDPDPRVRSATQTALSSLLLYEMAQPPSAATGTSRSSATSATRTATPRP